VTAAPTILLQRDGYPERPALDTALSRALLRRASDGELAETFRLHVPGRIVAFGKQDVISPGYAAAVAAARSAGFAAVERLAGGRAAVFHERTLAFSWTIPDPDPRSGITARFRAVSDLMARAFSRLGGDARVGELPGEYCPGTYSVNLDGAIKVMGVGQRLARGAAHVGGVVVVGGSDLVREVLIPVYRALDLEWRPATAGALEDRLPGLTTGAAAAAILRELGETARLVESTTDAATMRLASALEADHLSPAPSDVAVDDQAR
jgi:octanoyl-[GcvH]:protein N-octanoyltransferase